MKLASFACSLLLLVACGTESKKATDSTAKLGALSFTELSDGTLEIIDSKLRGSGRIVFNEPIGSVNSNKNFRVDVVLQENGYIEIHGYSDAKLKHGIVVKISRATDKVTISSFIEGSSTTEERSMEVQNPSDVMRLSADFHNAESPAAHTLLWHKDEARPNDDNAIFNSDADGSIGGNGKGSFWGLALADAAVEFAAARDAVFSH